LARHLIAIVHFLEIDKKKLATASRRDAA